MLNPALSKLIYFLAAFDLEERRKFKDFLHSPIFNQKTEPRLLYDHILSECLRPTTQELDDLHAWNAVWPGVEPDLGRLHKVKTHLMTLVLQFLEFRGWQQDSGTHGGLLLRHLNQMEDKRFFEQYFRKAKQELEEEKPLKLGTYSDQFALELQYFIHRQKHEARSADNHLQETISALDKHLLAELLKFAYVTSNQSRIVGGARLPDWMERALGSITFEHVSGEPLLEIYFLLHATLQEDAKPEDLHHLKRLVLQHAPNCKPDEAFDLYTAAINNLNRHSKRTGNAMLEEVFELYTSLVEWHIKKMGGGLKPEHFKNIVSIGMRLGHTAYVAQLLSEAKALLTVSGIELQCALDFSQGVYHFFMGEFSLAVRCFNAVLAEVKDIFYLSDARAYLLMCFYETGDSLGMESLAHSFRMFLSRSDRVSEQYKSNYLSFIAVFRKVLATPPNDQFRLQNLKAEIESLQFSGGKAWLLQKVKEISEGA